MENLVVIGIIIAYAIARIGFIVYLAKMLPLGAFILVFISLIT